MYIKKHVKVTMRTLSLKKFENKLISELVANY